MNTRNRIPLSINWNVKFHKLGYSLYLILKYTPYDSINELLNADPVLNPNKYADNTMQEEMWDLRRIYLMHTGKKPKNTEGS